MAAGEDRYRYFRIEARELVGELGQGALDLEKGRSGPDIIARLLRAAHTLKGAARVVKQLEIAEHAHQLEDRFAALRGASTPPSRDQIDEVLALVDRIGACLSALPAAGDGPAGPPAGQPVAADGQEPVHTARPDAADLETVGAGVARALVQLSALGPRLEEAARIGRLIELVEDQLAGFHARAGVPPAERLRAEKVRSLVGELRVRFHSLRRELASGLDRIEQEARQAGEAAARLRLLPASAMFTFLERGARDAAHAVGTQVRFDGRGGDIRVDGETLSAIQGALLQLVRNAVAHGIEPPATRRAAGKPVEGRIEVTVARRGPSVVFTCSDDGAGVDVEAVRRRLPDGLEAAGGKMLTDDQVLERLLEGGLSTSRRVTDVSGRGIGLDVVRAAAARLGGTVAIRSRRSIGTTIELVLPAAIASLPALLVEAGGVSAAIPLDAVRQTLRVTPETVIDTGHGLSIVLEDGNLPVAPLDRVIRPSDPVRPMESAAPAFVVEAGGRPAAFLVDRVLGVGTLAMRPLPPLAPAAAAVLGVSPDPGGGLRLVLDPARLAAERPRPVDAAPPAPRPAILVVDDSLTTRMLEQSILESAGYAVTLASSGEEGLARARAGGYGLFLVDVEMPGMDGFAFLEQVRADPMLRTTPAILVTSRESPADRQRGREVGAQGYMVKSEFDQAALLDQIRALVS